MAAQQALFNQMVQTKGGQTFLLNLTVAGKEADEGATYNQIIGFIDDPQLASMSQRHYADEMRHAAMFRGCLSRLGLPYVDLPEELKMVPRIRNATGAYFGRIQSAQDMVNACAVIYAIEQRSIRQFAAWAAAFESVDVEIAQTYRAVLRDDEHHLNICTTIGRRYATSDQAWQAALIKAVTVTDAAMQGFGMACMQYLMEQESPVAGNE